MAQVDILISSSGNSGNSPNNTNNNNQNQSQTENIQPKGVGGNKGLIFRSVYANQLATAGINVIKQGINYAKSNYGNFTGDYIGQQKIDNVFSTVNGLLSIGGAVVGGALVGGPVGAAVGAVVSGISIVSNAIQNEITYNLNLSKANRQANFNSQRIGRILTDGNR